MTTPLLKWTGHPLADVGVATLCAMVGKTDPEKLTLEDLDVAGKEIKAAYTDGVMTSYLTCVYMNAPYVQPNMKKDEFARKVARLTTPHRVPPDPEAEGLRCAFTGAPATLVLKRSEMPMLLGEGYFNFYPAGIAGLPLTAAFGLAIHALALGGRRSEGKLLIVHCDDPAYTLQFANQYLADNRRIIEMARSGELPSMDDPGQVLTREMPGGLNKEKRAKYPDAKGPESLVMSDLVKIITARKSGSMADSSVSVTAYHMSNSGQGPSLAIFNIPGEFVEFLSTLHGAEMGAKWARLVQRSWRAGKGGVDSDEPDATDDVPVKKARKKTAKPAARSGAGFSRNDLYNDLLAIFIHGSCDWQAATRFIRRHLLSDPTKYYFDSGKALNQAPRFGVEQLDLIDWKLTALFLQKVLGMNKERIELIKDFAAKLAELIDDHNDKRLFRQLVFTNGEWQYRALLTKAQRQYTFDRDKLPFTFDEYIEVFLNADPDERAGWSLIRDLISIRLVEVLHQKGFFKRNADVLANEEEEAETTTPVEV